MSDDYDVVVLGAGNAGLAAAGVARSAGQRVLVVESRDFGGVCPLRGCVPKKVLVAAAQALDAIARAGTHEISVGPATLDWPGLIARKQTFVDGVPEQLEQSLARRGIDVVRGRAEFIGLHEIAVGERSFSARRAVIATGSTPRSLECPGAELVIGSDEILELSQLPESITFVGGGVIAFEFAHVFARAGSRVTLLEAAPRVLPSLDEDAAEQIANVTRALGVEIETGVSIDGIEERDGQRVVQYRVYGRDANVECEVVSIGAGRVADLAGLNLAAAGITLDHGSLAIDDYLRSVENPDLFFAGDAIPGRPQLSPVATYEGRVVGHNLTHESLMAVEYGHQPAAVYTVPALATVGMSEQAASEVGFAFDVHTSDMRDWRSARTYGETVAWAKILVETGSDRLLGAHLVGHGAEETIHAFALAIEKGITAAELRSRVYAYPTFHSDIKFMVS